MIRDLHEKLGEVTFESLFAGIEPPALVRGGTIAHGEEETVIKRGTLLGKKDGKLSVYAGKEKSGDPDCILTDDVTVGTADENVTVYITGNFNRDALIVGEGYSITAADEDALRVKGILLAGVSPCAPGPLPPAGITVGEGKTKFYEMDAEKLQSDITITDGVVSGTLHYVENYTGFDKQHAEKQKGNYFALTIDAPEGADVYVELVGAVSKPGMHKLPADDRIIVARVTNPATQKIRITIVKDGYTTVSVYSLAGLVLEEKAQD